MSDEITSVWWQKKGHWFVNQSTLKCFYTPDGHKKPRRSSLTRMIDQYHFGFSFSTNTINDFLPSAVMHQQLLFTVRPPLWCSSVSIRLISAFLLSTNCLIFSLPWTPTGSGSHMHDLMVDFSCRN